MTNLVYKDGIFWQYTCEIHKNFMHFNEFSCFKFIFKELIVRNTVILLYINEK